MKRILITLRFFTPFYFRTELCCLLSLLSLFFSDCFLKAGPLPETGFLLGTDALNPHPFMLNPAAYLPETAEASFLFLRSQYGNTLITNRNGNISQQENDSSDSFLALSMHANAGSGLGIGIDYQMYEQEEQNQLSSRGNTRFTEAYSSRYTAARAVVDITEKVILGFMIRFLDAEQELVGNFFINPSSLTRFKSSLFGTGGGIRINMDKFQAGGAYLPPMKGRAEIYTEEKIITLPGIAELSAAYQTGSYGLGAAVRRWLYKQDDRPEGTTLNDENQSQVNLLGLNADHNYLFLREQQQAGIDYKLKNGSLLKLSLSRFSAEFNDNPDRDLPGENQSNQLIQYLMGHFFFVFIQKNLTLTMGYTRSLNQNIRFVSGSGTIEYKGRKQNIIAGIQTSL